MLVFNLKKTEIIVSLYTNVPSLILADDVPRDDAEGGGEPKINQSIPLVNNNFF